MIIHGDCIEIMAGMEPNSVDAIVTDPPYGLEFMGKEWDKLEPKRQEQRWSGKDRDIFSDYGIKDKNFKELPSLKVDRNPKCRLCGHYKFSGTPCKCENPHWEVRHFGNEQQAFHREWLTEAYRVLKPGGSALVMGGTRTFHRLACAIEDTGFIIKDCLMWIYGSGFPKAQDLGKMIDKRGGNGKPWDGFKVGGIKPAYEPIIWAVKPPEGSYIDNVLKWGVGAVNVDECRVGYQNKEDGRRVKEYPRPNIAHNFSGFESKEGNKKGVDSYSTKGRFPANVILDEEAGRMLDEQSGVSRSGVAVNRNRKPGIPNEVYGQGRGHSGKDKGFYDSGGASRFFYCAKASRSERGKDNNHPTVKPLSLMSWLIRLITREGQIVLDPFFGSGTTGIAARECRRKFIGIERESEYIEIAKSRIEDYEKQPTLGGMT